MSDRLIEFNRDTPEEIEKRKEFEKFGWYVAAGMSLVHPALRARLLGRCDTDKCPSEMLINLLRAVQDDKKPLAREIAIEMGIKVPENGSICQSIIDQIEFESERRLVRRSAVQLACKMRPGMTAKEYAQMLRDEAAKVETRHEEDTAAASKREEALRGSGTGP